MTLFFMGLTVTTPAFAFHYSGQRWSLTTVNVAYDLNSLGNLKNTSGNPIGWVAVTNDIDVARNNWNNLPSRWYIDRLTSTSNNWVAAAISPTRPAQTQCYWFLWLLDCDTTMNNTLQWTTGTGGFFGPYGISEVARHEFGHFVRFLDVHRTDTVMFDMWDPDIYKSIKSADSSELTSVYG